VSGAGRRALVSAGTSGIGRGIAERLVADGHRVFVTGVRPEHAAQAAEEIGAVGHAVADLTVPGSARRVVEEALASLGGVDILISNSGPPRPGRFVELTAEDWESSYRMVLDSAIELTRGVVPGMSAQGWGRLIYVASAGVIRPLPLLHLSNVMRAGVQNLAHSLAAELGPDGITTHVLAPGFIDTDRWRRVAAIRAERDGLTAEQLAQRDLESVPLGRLGTPEDIAAVVSFLCGEEAWFSTGVTHVLEGGTLHLKSVS
jgi:3-oxoacyl-[acyl-carrier protein] reductase